ncbi:hypothetical protein [Glycomyces paridis]|uniref:Uncharacterized protein n=1 Tax=Glycomyces paridis TaxID=2126555 RepID=A0A4S8P0R1_9ACTN|nr:hypothetical protein [Glycomyces paridis]THV23577.1 hypothetical protein E9998_22540 [Glycomyces paridis]
MAAPPASRYGPPVLPAAPTRPREIGLVRGLLMATMALCLVGAGASIYSLTREVTAPGVIVTAATVYFAVQSAAAPAPLARGSRWAWVWTFASTLMGMASGIPVIATGLDWFAMRPYVLAIGLVWTVLYAWLLGALSTRPVRAWVFA